MNSAGTVNLKHYQLAALLVLFMTAFAAPLTIAFNIGTVISAFGASRAEAGLVMTVEGVSVSIAALVCSQVITKYYLKSLLFFGLTFVVVGNGLTMLATDVTTMIACRVLAGIGIGTVVCAVMATAARTPKPEMTFGWVNGCAGAFISLLGLSVPYVISRAGIDGAYGLYTVLALVGLVLILVIPNSKAVAHVAAAPLNKGKSVTKWSRNAGWIALLGLGIFFFGQAGIAAFVARIGESIDVSLKTVGTIFFFGGLLTIIGPIAAGVVGSRFGATRPLVFIGAIFCLAVLGITIGGEKMSFYLSVPMIMILPAILLPSFLGGLAVVDPTGRLAGAQPAFATMGGAMGPVAAGIIADVGGFGALGWFVVAVLVTGLALMAAGTLKADGIRKMMPQPAI